MAAQFAFAFDDPKWSDRIICLVVKESKQGNKGTLFLSDGGCTVLRRIHVSSVILASESQFFKTLLTNGMRETQSKEIQIQVCSFLPTHTHLFSFFLSFLGGRRKGS